MKNASTTDHDARTPAVRAGFQHLLHFGLILLQQMLVGGFEAHHQHRLRVGSAQQAPAFGKKHAHAVDVHGLVPAS